MLIIIINFLKSQASSLVQVLKLIMQAPALLLKRGREGHQEKESDRWVGVGGGGD